MPDVGQEKTVQLRLLVFGLETYATYALPATGTVVIGRGDQAEIRIDDRLLSRLHARLLIDSSDRNTTSLAIEDLTSANGTWVRGQRISPGEICSISLSEGVEIGQTTILVVRSGTTNRLRRLLTHGYFEMRLEEECERTQRSQRPFAVLRLRLEGVPDSIAGERLVAGCVRRSDVMAAYGPNEYECLLVEASPEDAELIAAAIQKRLEASGIGVQMGLACCPRDGRSADALSGQATKALRGSEVMTRDDVPSIVVADAGMRHVYDAVQRVAEGDASVLIIGETGVGKEVIAETLHRSSRRANKTFLRLNCATFDTLLESELFGQDRDAPGGERKGGLLEVVDGGTVFLDEIADLPPSAQAKLFRVVEEQQVHRAGSPEAKESRPPPIDVRFVSATNADLEHAVTRGTFRKDLYYRINRVTIVVPPLRERTSEIEPLARTFAAEARTRMGIPDEVQFTSEAIDSLLRYSWPGNVRELKNMIERAVMFAGANPISRHHLPIDKLESTTFGGPTPYGARELVAPPPHEPPTSWDDETAETELGEAQQSKLRGEIEELERTRILEALERCNGNQTQAAKFLGISRRTLIARLDLYGLPRPRKNT